MPSPSSSPQAVFRYPFQRGKKKLAHCPATPQNKPGLQLALLNLQGSDVCPRFQFFLKFADNRHQLARPPLPAEFIGFSSK